MSTLKQLIKKFCPQGVEYVRLGDVCNLIIGFAFKSNLFRDIGSPVCRTKDIQENKIDFSSMKCFNLNDYSNNLKKYIIEPNDIVIGMSGTIKVGINKTNKHCYLNQRVGKFVCDKTKIVDKFLYYFLCNSVSLITKKISDGSVKNLGNNDLLEMQIPLPSLPVQEEIVKILDKFTDLENELENELRMRKMQFNAYRDKLLTFDKNGGVKFEKLGTIAYVSKGKQLNKDNLFPNGRYAVINGGVKPTGYWNKYNFHQDLITISQGGASCGFVDFQNKPFWAGAHCYVITDESSDVNYKFLYYVLKNKVHKLMKLKHGAGIPSLTKSSVETLKIPVPPLENQKEIVEKLDKFNDMCNEISEGLPLEIELRKKQKKTILNQLLKL